ncbi:hypothetical protein [Polynucleobacter sphagniphilus]|uniref:hypothetical protein n=1 Tax=Polynucleobacter sphagniphilus TaxID=1743169 RepID=UPI0024749B7B|nr:hypothetical protein [Polynucleobacter sphagniphilus]MDH6154919.1 hypothetical protein [Polynucleobacter sphagniphilus]MDH6524553.1 hypothetical protein [Polynucleobacter sphagniphilus]
MALMIPVLLRDSRGATPLKGHEDTSSSREFFRTPTTGSNPDLLMDPSDSRVFYWAENQESENHCPIPALLINRCKKHGIPIHLKSGDVIPMIPTNSYFGD